MEASASGPPVIASWNPNAVYVTGGGRVSRVASDDRFRAKLVELLQAATERSRLAARGCAQAAKFALYRMVETYFQLDTGTASGR